VGENRFHSSTYGDFVLQETIGDGKSSSSWFWIVAILDIDLEDEVEVREGMLFQGSKPNLIEEEMLIDISKVDWNEIVGIGSSIKMNKYVVKIVEKNIYLSRTWKMCMHL
jgi:hypothetical protein